MLNFRLCLVSVLLNLQFQELLCVDPTKLDLDPDEVRTFEQLVESRGFTLQEHHAITEDGYILTIHRVVPAVNYDPFTYNVHRKPVILFHGLLGDSAMFFFNSPFDGPSNDSHCGDNFGFCLVQSGRYDVWAGNARGNRFSRGHVRLRVVDPEFWKFSWDDIALHDLPAILAKVRLETGRRMVAFVGHSQGSATLFALLSHRPEFGRHIRPFISWAPAVFIQHALSAITAAVDLFSHTLNHVAGELIITNRPVNNLFQYGLCRGGTGNALCSRFLQLLFGPSDSLNTTRVPTYFHHFPSPCSNYQMAHWGQIWETGEFARFDYDEEERNIAAYGTAHPPEFPLQNIRKDMKLVIMYGRSDWMVPVREVHRLLHKLRSNGIPVIDYLIPKERWNHIDFSNAIGAGRLVYDQTLGYLDSFS